MLYVPADRFLSYCASPRWPYILTQIYGSYDDATKARKTTTYVLKSSDESDCYTGKELPVFVVKCERSSS